jgi:hypothetical protein
MHYKSSYKATTHRAGGSSPLPGDPRSMRARKREHPVRVRFARADEVVPTREGLVKAHAGDAIVTGPAGEQWPVRPATFSAHYRPQPPLAAGDPGTYLSVPIVALALRMDYPFAVELPGGERLAGQGGDWLVEYGDGSLAVVAATIFAMTYELVS